MKKIGQGLGFKYTNIVADAGYESEENYLFIEGNGQTAFIKPANYEISKTRKYQKDISRFENMSYDADNDCYICKNNNRLTVSGSRIKKTATGYQREITRYPDKPGRCLLLHIQRSIYYMLPDQASGND